MSEVRSLTSAIPMDTFPASLGDSETGYQPKLQSRSGPASRRDYVIGIGLLLVVVILWTLGNFVTQDLFEDGYDKPFLVTYLNTSAFSFYLLPFLIRRALVNGHGGVRGTSRRTRSEYQPLVTDDASDISPDITIGNEGPDHPTNATAVEIPDSEPLTTHETAKLAAVFCSLWFIANWTVNASLGYTSVASATILSSMSGFFTLGIGRLFRVETLTIVKCAAVATSFGGVALVSLSDSSQAQTPGPQTSASSPSFYSSIFQSGAILGDTLALLSALFYALYVTLLKVRIRNESRIDMQLFFGFVGLFNLLTLWPLGIILHLTGIERLESPHTSKAIVSLLINMGITLSSDYIYVIAMLKTTPLVVTIGLSLTMPLAVLGDFLLGRPAKVSVVVGAAIPKETRRRAGAHAPSAKLSSRQFAVQSNAVEHVEVGEQSDKSGAEILHSMAEPEEPPITLKKKEKQALKHELFVQRLEQSRSPYSKSHERRLKRKAREQVAGGMNEMKAALSAVEDALPVAVVESTKADVEESEATQERCKNKPKPGQIGEGKGAPLTKNQRKRALKTERMRIPMILATPQFASNPFQTIRTHAQNTLVKHQPPQ
ncbi:hypothetical protein CERSUDRAFT_147823 [Gelatoporia subvermispora B]|uniref:Ribosome biogenesis protein SLX9 n=1 Tax=Ceriporiopsis subvermispora (strain B) TaxID=914234 RepID=M2QYF9_CERS8|nr:hypothetical protein CERSUDRAFT_147823 [Gelatoporia subvermispora B]